MINTTSMQNIIVNILIKIVAIAYKNINNLHSTYINWFLR